MSLFFRWLVFSLLAKAQVNHNWLFQFDILTSSIPLEPWICVQSIRCYPPLSEYTGISWECQYFNETIVNSPLAANDGPSPTFCGPPILTTALFSTSVGTMQQNLFSLALLRPQKKQVAISTIILIGIHFKFFLWEEERERERCKTFDWDREWN